MLFLFTNCIGDAFLNLATVLRCPCRQARFSYLVPLICGAIYSSVHNVVARTKPLPLGSSKLKEKTMMLCELKCTYKPSAREAETEESQVLDQRWSYRESLSHTAKKATRDVVWMVECSRLWVQTPALQKKEKERQENRKITLGKADLEFIGRKVQSSSAMVHK